jgi:NAD(P)H-hydrate epimerase
MQQIDRAAIETIGIPRLLLMDHAGLAVARTVRRLVAEAGKAILVCCGTGSNGGDGLCAAWHLAHWGYQPHVVIVGAVRQLNEEPAVYAQILQALGVPLIELTSPDGWEALQAWLASSALTVDALLGIGLQGPVRPLHARLIDLINQAAKPVVSADVPSGLDADTGLPHGTAVNATVTVTFGLPKQGFFLEQGPAHVGELVVDDIGIPAYLLASG